MVPPAQVNRTDGRVWYIPHHGVYHPKEKTIRVVFDCGATYQGTSINCELLQGPNLTNTLIGVLTRFRKEPVALMADIQAMFHQVKVTDDDTDFLPFLWWPQGNVDAAPTEFRMTNFEFIWSGLFTQHCKLCTQKDCTGQCRQLPTWGNKDNNGELLCGWLLNICAHRKGSSKADLKPHPSVTKEDFIY